MPSERTPVVRWGLIFLAAALMAGGCRDKLEFSHRIHVREADCLDCHPGGDSEDQAGMPDEEACLQCHEVTEKVRYEKFLRDHPEETWQPTAAGTGELIFSHAVHADASVACEQCHPGIARAVKGRDAERLSMAQCLACHTAKEAGRDCRVCHAVYRADTAPPDHGKNWPQVHGMVVREDARSEDTCYICHARADCLDCHRVQKPRDHTQIWKERGHGVMSRLDRRRCAACHTSDYCARCHMEVDPRP